MSKASEILESLNEAEKQFLETAGKEVFYFQINNVSEDTSIDEVTTNYYSQKEAIDAARESLKDFIDEEDLYEAVVYAGEFEQENGDIYGEPVDVYTISNQNKETTAKIRKEQGFVRVDVDEYLK